VIVGVRVGFETFDRLSWADVHGILTHLTEERIGTASRAEGERENAEYERTLAALKR